MSLRLRYLLVTLALVAVGLGVVFTRSGGERPAIARPQPSSAAVPRLAPPPPPPSAREILERGGRLALGTDQKARLTELDRGWRAESTRLEADLAAAEAEFSTFMAEAQKGRGTSLDEIQRRSAAVRELGGILRERRKLHGEAAVSLLDDRQRARLAPATAPSNRRGDR